MAIPYNKPSLSIPEQIALLEQRGLKIEDPAETAHFLENVGYYRLAGYWQIFQSDPTTHTFNHGATFKQIIELYNFDRELRLLILDAIERIEVSFRSRMINEMCKHHDPLWFTRYNLFFNHDTLDGIMDIVDKELARADEDFLTHHRRTYNNEEYPPCWKTLQVLSFGTLSQLFGNIKNETVGKKEIALSYGLASPDFLHSWMQSISVLRNLCAHHSRVCYRVFSYPPKLLHRPRLAWVSRHLMPSSTGPLIQMLFLQLCSVKYLLHTVSPGNNFSTRLMELMIKYPSIEPNRMGFPPGWENEPLWID